MSLSLIAVILLVGLTDLCDTISQIFLKVSINSFDLRLDTVKKVIKFVAQLIRYPKVWISFVFSTLSLGVWIFVLSKADLNFAYSLDSMRYVFITVASVFFLKEKVGFGRWLGIICVVLGISLVAAG